MVLTRFLFAVLCLVIAPRNSTAQQEPRLLKGHADAVGAVAWSPDGNHLASVSNDETVKIWDAEKGREI